MNTRFATLFNFRDSKLKRTADLGITMNTEPDMTQQSDLPDTDINVIMKRYGATGQIPQVQETPNYGDFSIVSDYRSALEAVRHANEQFETVPAEIRATFGNDPARFLEFVSDEKNLPQLREWKLAAPAKEEPLPPPSDNDNATTYYDDHGTRRERNSHVTQRATGYGHEQDSTDANQRSRAEPPASGSGGSSRSGSEALRHGEAVRPYGAGKPGRGPQGQ